jgi:hypothetical protein
MSPRFARLAVTVVVFAGAIALAAVGCRQGAGEPCQIDSDCEDGLTCSGQGLCSTTSDNGGPIIDAAPADARPDATFIDGAPPPPVDAAVDATVDAASDAGADAT